MVTLHPDAQLIAIARAAIVAGRKACEAIREEDESRVERDLDDDDFVSVRVSELLDRKNEVEERAFATRATTIEGLRAKIEILTHNYFNGVFPVSSSEHVCEWVLASIVADLTGPGTGVSVVTADLH